MRAHLTKSNGALDQFNHLLNTLTQTLAEQSLITKEKHILLHKVITQIDVAIIAVDNSYNIALMNPAAEKLFNCRFEAMHGWPVKQLGLEKVLSGEYRQVVEFEIKEYKKKVYIHTDEYFEKGVKKRLIFITDIQDILRDEERQAWQKLLRVLSHEINNSLAPISSISDTLSLLLSKNKSSSEFDDDLKDGLSVITERSHSLNEFIQSYQQLTQLPPPTKCLLDIRQLMSSIILLFDDANISLVSNELTIYADKNQLQQVLVNLVKNAYESMQDNPNGEITIKWERQTNKILIHVLDQGCGIENTDNLFIPFYTTKQEGSGIGLVLSRQIIMNHGGDLTIKNRLDDIGAKATLYLPSI
ncbi:ATP-binding protein [Pseudoalteromonas sp. C2R02]|uniref:sensor histidine kinase n=1 Tax=Pseudoalteromonas sp. C2R02 TaxID=2841565 RepID=UPI002090102E|nr:ATP-binding protein [Pseudoalteromonas sp. C2R02]